MPDNFIGWKSDDGLLEVVDVHGKQGRNTTFKVICHKCKEDTELFPAGYFVSTKSNLVSGYKPCGCAFNPKWNKEQYLVLARRAAKDRFIVHGFAEEFHGSKTKLELECLVDGYKWVNSNTNIINKRAGCPKCCKNIKLTEPEAFDRCKAICEAEGYEPLGFPTGYKNGYSRFEYKCLKHGKQSTTYSNFVNNGTRCKFCKVFKAYIPEETALQFCAEKCKVLNYTFIGFTHKYDGSVRAQFKYSCVHHGEQINSYNSFIKSKTPCKQCKKEIDKKLTKTRELKRDIKGNGNGYYHARRNETDFLYVVSFGTDYIKVGRSFNVVKRLYEMESVSGVNIADIGILGIYTDTHLNVYNMEQEIHATLEDLGYENSSVKWSTECFNIGCEKFTNNYLKLSGIECVL